MRIETVTDEAGLRDLETAWWALWRRAGRCPFQSPAWMLAWWRRFGNRRPVVAVAWEGGDLVGLLGCYGLDGVLLPIGAGLTDYQDVLGGEADALLAAVLAAGGPASCHLTDLPPGARLRGAAAPSGWCDSVRESDPCPVLVGPAPPGRLRDTRQARHRAERRGGWRVEIANADTLDAGFDAFGRLHALRWPDEDPRVGMLRRLAAPGLLAEGALLLALLRIGGEVAAGCYALLAPGQLLLYVSGFDPRFAYESPGTLLLGWFDERAGRRGARGPFPARRRGVQTRVGRRGAVECDAGAGAAVSDDPVALCLAGRISAPVALARLVLAGESGEAIAARLVDVRGAEELRRLAAGGLDRLAGVASAVDHRADSVAAFRAGFERAVAISPEASVAAYSLGDPALLAAATAELVGWLDARGLARSDVLDLGCGIGRVAAGLTRARSVLGLDVAPAMIAEARRRYGGDQRLRFEVTDGVGIGEAGPFDLILAVDSFPYLVAAGVAERHVADAARMLRPGGALAVFNLSYRGLEADRTDAREWAGRYGLQLVCDGEQPLRLWDGRAFLFGRKRAPPRHHAITR